MQASSRDRKHDRRLRPRTRAPAGSQPG